MGPVIWFVDLASGVNWLSVVADAVASFEATSRDA
jgi:hypothetical protein